MRKSYRKGLPRPDENEDVCPEVGRKRLTVGNVLTRSEFRQRQDAKEAWQHAVEYIIASVYHGSSQ
jgi:hypothetical protein